MRSKQAAEQPSRVIWFKHYVTDLLEAHRDARKAIAPRYVHRRDLCVDGHVGRGDELRQHRRPGCAQLLRTQFARIIHAPGHPHDGCRRQGTISNIGVKLSWKRFADGRARARVDLTDPPRQAGTVVLLTERESEDDEDKPEPEVVLYKPGERRDRLITVSALSGEMLGTDFSYEDFAHFYGTDSDVNVVRLDDEQWEGRTVVVVQSSPKDPEAAYDRGSSYSRIVTRFDAEQCVPLVTRFFEQGDDLRKELIADPDEIRIVEQRAIPHRLTMHDLSEQTRTILTIDEIEFDPEIKDLFFARSSLKRGR